MHLNGDLVAGTGIWTHNISTPIVLSGHYFPPRNISYKSLRPIGGQYSVEFGLAEITENTTEVTGNIT